MAVQAAQQRLQAIRHSLGITPNEQPICQSDEEKRPFSTTAPSLTQTLERLPAHLGWHSHSVRRSWQPGANRDASDETQERPLLPFDDQPVVPTSPQKPVKNTIQLYPDMAVGLLQQKQAAVGRVWLLLRFLDEQGQGWIALDDARRHLTKSSSPWRICGWRQLRNLLAQGDPIFWQRQNGRIWLQSLAKVALALGVTRLQTAPVALPVAVLTEKIGTVRAHFYASFHSGRANEAADDTARPIARATLEAITAVSPRIQRLYEQTAQVTNQQHYAIGATHSAAAAEQAAWEQGHGTFVFVDHEGRQGPRGQRYVAWQLPNSYAGPHQPNEPRQRKRVNKQLADLLAKGTAGNGQDETDHPAAARSRFQRRYHANGRLAANNRTSSHANYWQDKTLSRRQGIWHHLPPT